VGVSGRSFGFVASLEHVLDDDLIVVVCSNVYTSLTQSMASDLVAIARGEERRPVVPDPPVVVPAEALARYVGRYRFGPDFAFNPNLAVEVRQTRGGLVLDGSGAAFLIPLSADRFVDRLYGGTVRFEAGPDGRVRSLVWSFGRDYLAGRIE
jgi:hypothetical protein